MMPEERALRVLLVDDDVDQLAICQASLERAIPNVEVVCAHSGAECLEMVKTGKWDGAFLDYKMPGLDGLEILQRLQQYCPEVPVILITGCGDEETAVAAMKHGAADYVMKSLDYPAILPTVLRHTLAIQNKQRQLDAERTRNVQLATIIQTTRALAHEINNPLQIISGTCELMSYSLASIDAELAQQAGDMVTVCERIASVIQRLYTVTHPVTQTRLGFTVLDIDASSQPPASVNQ